jgi:hypothetical protein
MRFMTSPRGCSCRIDDDGYYDAHDDRHDAAQEVANGLAVPSFHVIAHVERSEGGDELVECGLASSMAVSKAPLAPPLSGG